MSDWTPYLLIILMIGFYSAMSGIESKLSKIENRLNGIKEELKDIREKLHIEDDVLYKPFTQL